MRSLSKKYPQALDLVVKTHRDALRWINDNKQAAVELGAREHGISIKDAQTLADWSNFYGTVTDKDIDSLYLDQRFLIENGMMQKEVDIRALVLPSARR